MIGPSIHRIMINESTFGLFAEVIAAISKRDGKFRTQKQVLVEGLDVFIRSAVFERFLWLKTYDRSRHRGDRAFFFQFDGNEKRLVQETRALLEQDSGAKITTHDALILALLAVARSVGMGADPARSTMT